MSLDNMFTYILPIQQRSTLLLICCFLSTVISVTDRKHFIRPKQFLFPSVPIVLNKIL